MAEEKVRFQMRISPETDKMIKSAMPLANCKSQNEFVEKALLHYCSCLQSESAAAVLAPSLVSALKDTVHDSEYHICRMLFKVAVELNIMMNIAAAKTNVTSEILDGLRAKCVKEVSKTNGNISFKDAVKYQNYID